MATGIFQGISAGADAIADGIRRRRELVLAQQEKQEARAYEQSIYERGMKDKESERQRVSQKEQFDHEEKLAGMKAAGKDISRYQGLSPQAFNSAIKTEQSQAEENDNNQQEMIDLIKLKLEDYPPEQTAAIQQMIAQSVKGFPVETVEQIDARRGAVAQQEMNLARARNPVKPIVQGVGGQGGGQGGGQVGRGGRTIQSVNKQDFNTLSEAQTTWDSQRTSDDMSQSRSMAKNQIVNLLMKYGIQADDQMAVRVLDKVPGYSFNEIIQRGSGSPSTQPSSGQESQAVGKDGKPIFKDGKAVMTDGAGNYWIGE